MMDLWATKTHAERQDEEAERLVRPAPKLKPPRRDRRREVAEADSDPDQDEKDLDESRNYKDIGGSVGRVVVRFLEAKAPLSKFIKVKHKDTGRTVRVTENTLKEKPGAYEKITEEEEEKGFLQQREQLEDLSKDVPQLKKLLDNLKKKGPVHDELMSMSDAGMGYYSWWHDLDKQKKWPKDVETLGDLIGIVEAKPKGAPKTEESPKIELDSPATQPSTEAPKKPGLSRPSVGEKGPATVPAGPAGKPSLRRPSVGEPQPEDPPGARPKERTTLKSKPNEPSEDKTKGPKKGPKKDAPPEEPKAEGPAEDKASEQDKQDDREMAKQVAKKWVEKGRHKRPEFKRFLEAIPTTDVDEATGEVLVLVPGGKRKKKVPFDKLPPEAQKNLIDSYSEEKEQKGLEKSEARKLRKKQEASSEALSNMDPEVRDALMQLSDPNSEPSRKAQELAKEHDLKDISPDKLFPELKGKFKDVKSVEEATGMAEAARDYDALPEQEKAGIPDPPRRPVSDEEKNQTAVLLASHLPPDVAASLIAQDIHPDDAGRLIATYQAGKVQNQGVKNLESFAADAAEFYETDPTRVKPPKKWMKDGQEVSFDSLSPEEKGEAMRQHQMNVLAHSMAAKEHLTSALSLTSALTGKPRIPTVLSSTLAETMLTKKTPAEAHKMAQTAFDTMMEHGEHIPIKDSVVSSLFSKLDPQSKIIARGFMQANDYHEAKAKFLGTTQGFSEWDTPQDIVKGLQKADEFFGKRNKLYGVSERSQHPTASSTFRKRVVDRIQALKPDKAPAVQAWVQKVESREYEGQHKDWKKEHDAWEARRKKHQEAQGKGGYREQGRVTEFEEPEPVKPVKPDIYKGKLDKEAEAPTSKDLARLMTASRVVRRYLISTYSGCESMGHRSDKSAVYHGIEPEAPTAYPDWGQAHQRDLGESDYAQILTSAKKWLSATVISRPAEGTVKDQQLRAALDLALRTSRYDGALDPVVYNALLARLAGVPEPGLGQTLQTIRGSTCAPRSGEANGQSNSRETETMTTKLSAEQSKRASEILGRLDNLAKEIQDKHASWGMTFEAAKTVVNGLDSVADSFEKSAFGPESFERRQREILAAVVQREPDEPYMDSFKNPMEPVQTDADEPYMGAYGDDQSSAVQTGKSTAGRPLAP
jgi:hypothetical protein